MEKPLLPSTNRAASPERLLHAPHLSCAHFGRCSYPLPLRLLLTRFRAISRDEHYLFDDLFFVRHQLFEYGLFCCYQQRRREHA